ncbi:NAD(P)-dependent oxidoreductase [Mycobacterium sp. ACS1612]|uniref:NAD(P)-dependent oxidoreductase n=1 Tax=Mycobacterium sp. ACS1612 TaxID=1834117 RepID=UPI00210173C8|nr:NAD(P)-dependent oxidoreductase [Mycobacterium sp. ACS1612]
MPLIDLDSDESKTKAKRLKVLVPLGLGLEAMETPAAVEAVYYQPGDPWPPELHNATVVVVGYENAAAIGARFVELPDLRLIQTLNAGYEQWLPLLPDGVMLSNGRGAHGGSSAEWVVAALLAIYRDLRLFNEQQSEGIWRDKDTETLIGKRVVVLGAGDLAVNLAARLAPFETEVTLVGRRPRQGIHALSDIDTLLPDADVVVAMLPGDESTRHIINAEFLAKLRDGTVVVNVWAEGARSIPTHWSRS